MAAELLLALPVIAATFAVTVAQGRLLQRLRAEREALLRLEAQRVEAQHLQQAEQRLAEIQRLSEAAISGGTQVVRAVHKGIAAVPFTVLENIPSTRDKARAVRQVHDAITDGVYSGIGLVNRGIGSLLRQGLSEPPGAAKSAVAAAASPVLKTVLPAVSAEPSTPPEPAQKPDTGSSAT